MPVPFVGEVIVIQLFVLLTFHTQPSAAVTFTVPVSALELCVMFVGEIVTVQGMPACVMVKLLLAIVSTPERTAKSVFDVTV